jgi:hypothetical protein
MATNASLTGVNVDNADVLVPQDKDEDEEKQLLLGFKSLFLHEHLVKTLFEKDPFRYRRNKFMKAGEPGSYLADGKTKKVFTYELAESLKLPRIGNKEAINKRLQTYFAEEGSESLPAEVEVALAIGPLADQWKEACQNDIVLKAILLSRKLKMQDKVLMDGLESSDEEKDDEDVADRIPELVGVLYFGWRKLSLAPTAKTLCCLVSHSLYNQSLNVWRMRISRWPTNRSTRRAT